MPCFQKECEVYVFSLNEEAQYETGPLLSLFIRQHDVYIDVAGVNEYFNLAKHRVSEEFHLGGNKVWRHLLT
jgi:hypothetical protein